MKLLYIRNYELGMCKLNTAFFSFSLQVPTMYYRRDRGDMLECYKYTHDKYKSPLPFTLDEDKSRRGHSYKLKKPRVRSSLRKHFFSERVVNLWNSLPEKAVQAPSFNSVKNRLDRHWLSYTYNLKPLPDNRMKYQDKYSDSEENDSDVTIVQA